MFILQTTITILIAFLALKAYNKLRSRIAKGKSRRKDLEAPGSPKINSKNEVDGTSNEKKWREPDLSGLSIETCKEMDRHKLLYYKLHNLEKHPDIIPECHDLLVFLLATTLADAFKDESDTILSVGIFVQRNGALFTRSSI
ncbi:hypothetical protein DM02DRAFT_650333 [Periconia macrospinosa]|uniref:Uncharacterized protein n=1 Tax=Periconia macrospinosa TaxID=97972 RepID=A0A2V1E5N7_9PLEO|nr:hypothetical protein DM02DRAFT_650333 [Periconia macrospinosa]